MPEVRECIAHYIYFHLLLKPLLGKTSLHLLALWADLTNQEKYPDSGTEGFPVRLKPGCLLLRGSRGRQTPLAPPILQSCDPKAASLESLSGLELLGVDYTGRAILLDFKLIYLKVCTIL